MYVETVIIVIFATIIGACVGSFINVVVYRLPKMMERQWLLDCLSFLRDYLQDINNPQKKSTEINVNVSTNNDSEFSKTQIINPEEQVNYQIDNQSTTINLNNENHNDIVLLINKVEGYLVDEQKNPPFNLLFPNSHCPSCKAQIPFYRNLPLITWLLQIGKSSCCQKPISSRYFFIELLGAILTFLAIWHFGISIKGFLASVFLLTLLALAAIDYETRLLPDSLTLPLVWMGIIINLYGIFTPIESAVYGAVFGYLILWTLYQTHKLITKREGMGFGDFKLTAAFGAWMGVKILPVILFIAAIAGIFIALNSMRVRTDPKVEAISFGPSLCFAAVIALFYGDVLIKFVGY